MLGTIRTLLLADPTITGLVGTNIFVGYATKEVQEPYIILEDLFQSPNDCKDFKSVMDSFSFAVTAVAGQFSTIETLLAQCRVVLVAYQDPTFKGISFDGMQEMYDGTQDYHVKTNSYKSLITVL